MASNVLKAFRTGVANKSEGDIMEHVLVLEMFQRFSNTQTYSSSTAQGGGGSFKNRKPIGEVGCCESGMAERTHCWTERCLRSPLFRSLSLTIYLPTYLSSMYLSIDLSISLSLICLSVYLRHTRWPSTNSSACNEFRMRQRDRVQ